MDTHMDTHTNTYIHYKDTVSGYNDSCTHTYKRIPVKHEPKEGIETPVAKQ